MMQIIVGKHASPLKYLWASQGTMTNIYELVKWLWQIYELSRDNDKYVWASQGTMTNIYELVKRQCQIFMS
jgi:uncharacterized protein YfkK (UPF0435 family)